MLDNAVSSMDAAVRAAVGSAAPDNAVRDRLAAAWDTQRAQEPDELQAVRLFARRLRTEKYPGIARALAAALASQAADTQTAALAGELASRLGDHGEALRIGRDISTRFPNAAPGLRLQLDALIALGLESDAAAVLQALPAQFQDAKWAARARQALAGADSDVAEVEGNDGSIALVAAAQSLVSQGRLDDAAAALDTCLQQDPGNGAALRLAATIAERRGQLDEAMRLWAEVRAGAPRSPAGFMGALRCLRRFGRLDLAAPILAGGRDVLWNDAGFVVLAAQVAEAARMMAEADQWWQRATELLPDDPGHALSYAIVLTGPRKGRRQRLPVILARLDAVHARFPEFAPAYAAHVEALRNSGQLQDADRLSETWCARFPGDLGLALARAGLHEELGRFDAALAELTEYRATAAPSPELEAAYIRALSCAGRHEDAEQLCASARNAAPRDRRFWVEYAHLALRRGDWTDCASRLREGLLALPNDERLTRELQTVRLQLAEPEPREDAAAVDGNLFARFESLGGSGMGCEFGMVQRKLGSDTVGLLRWARTNPPELIEALQQDFAGVGDDDNTVLTTVRLAADREEYVTRDRRYTMESHTFVRTADAPADRMLAQTCRRLRFLRGKLLEDLQAAEKIFVYRSQDLLDDEAVTAMYAALSRHGDAALLCVMRAPAGVAGGSLRVLGRGIYIGYVRYFARDESGSAGSDIESWSAVCAKADAAWRGAQA